MTDTTAHPADLHGAVVAISAAYAALRADPSSAAVDRALHEANAAVGALEPNLTTIVLGRLLVSIEDCHRDGRRSSSRLMLCARTTVRALRLDPRWASGPGGGDGTARTA